MYGNFLRSCWRSLRAGLVCLLAFAAVDARAIGYITLHNSWTNQIGYKMYRDGVYVGAQNLAAGATSSQYSDNSQPILLRADVYTPSYTSTNFCQSYTVSTDTNVTINVTGCAPPPVTHHNYCADIPAKCNTGKCGQNYWLVLTGPQGSGLIKIYPKHYLMPGNPPDCLEGGRICNPFGTDANGDGIPFTWTIWTDGCEKDYVPDPIDSGPGIDDPITDPPPNSGGDPIYNPGDPGNGGGDNGDTNRTGDFMLHQDLLTLIRIADEMNHKVSTWQKQDEQTELLSQIVTNTGKTNAVLAIGNTNDYTDVLNRIATNTDRTAKALEKTNEGWTVDDARAATTDSTNSIGSALRGMLPAQPHFVGEAFSSAWVISANMGGVQRTIDLRPTSYPLVWNFMQWLKAILQWAGAALCIWACFNAAMDKLKSMALIPTPKAGVIGAAIGLWNMAVQVPLAAAAVATIAGPVLALVTLWQETGILSWLSANWPLGSLVPGAREAYQMANAILPIEAWLGYLFIYLGFRITLAIGFFAATAFIRMLLM